MFMMLRILSILLFLMILSVPSVFSQNLDGTPYNPETDPDIDLYLSHWNQSMPRKTHGSLIERDILTQGDALNPPGRGRVLEYLNRFAHGTLQPWNETPALSLENEQEVLYVISGSGAVISNENIYDLHPGICVFIPEGVEFSLKNNGDEPLTMYVIAEPVPAGFVPRESIAIKDENKIQFNETVGHWSYQEKDFFLKRDGLATIHGVCTLTMDPMTIGHPHFHQKGCEEIWTTVSGQNIAFLGKEIRRQPPGTAYMIPPDGKTNHANINPSGTEPVVMLYVSVRKDIE